MRYSSICCKGTSVMLLLLSSIANGQICNSAVLPTAPDNRYQDNGNGTVTDLHTGLMWQQCSVGLSGSDCSIGNAYSFSWERALQDPGILNTEGGLAGFVDWRLPNLNELHSLVEFACHSPAINVNYFPNTLSGNYRSSSPAVTASTIWNVNFKTGHSRDFSYRNSDAYVRFVRIAQ